MVKFTEIKESAKTTLPSAPWSLKDTYKRTVDHNGHSYELTKYVRDPNLWQRLTCVLSAAWLWLKSCGKDQKKFTSQWDKALGRKQICLRFGTLQTSKKNEIELEGENIQIYEQGLKALQEKKYGDAQKAFATVAEQGYQPAFDHIRTLAEENHTDWKCYNYYLENTFVKLHFSDKQREAIKAAIEAEDGTALHQLTLEFVTNKKYPEAYFCGCEALQSGSRKTLEVIDKLKQTYPAPWNKPEDIYLLPQDVNELKKETILERDDLLIIANGYNSLLSNEFVPMDLEIQDFRKRWLAQQAICFYKLAIKRGAGSALRQLMDLQVLGWVDSAAIADARKELFDCLNRIEAEAKKTKDLKLWQDVIVGYGPLGFEEREVNHAVAWLKEVSKDPAFQPNTQAFPNLQFNHHLVRASAEAAKLGDYSAMSEINSYATELPNNLLLETRAAFAEAIKPTMQQLLNDQDINDDQDKILTLAQIYHALQNKAEREKWDKRYSEVFRQQWNIPGDPPKADPKKDEIKLNKTYEETYQNGLNAIGKKDYQSAQRALVAVAKIGYQPAFDHLRNLAEQNFTDWDAYNTALRYDPEHKLVKMQFSAQQRTKITTAIDKADGAALHQITLELIQSKKYPEAYLCGCEALKSGSADTLTVINDLKKLYQQPFAVNEQRYFSEWQQTKKLSLNDNSSKFEWRECAQKYDQLFSVEEKSSAMDKEIQECRKTWLSKQAIYYYREAVKRGDGVSLRELYKFQGRGYLNENAIQLAREERRERLHVCEALARKDNDLTLWQILMEEYSVRGAQELDFVKAAEWLKEVAQDSAFEPKTNDLEENEFNYNLIRVCAEAAKLGDLKAMKEIIDNESFLPYNFFNATREAFAKAVDPIIKNLLSESDINDNIGKILQLKEIFEVLQNKVEVEKWTQRLKELGHTFGKQLRS